MELFLSPTKLVLSALQIENVYKSKKFVLSAELKENKMKRGKRGKNGLKNKAETETETEKTEKVGEMASSTSC